MNLYRNMFIPILTALLLYSCGDKNGFDQPPGTNPGGDPEFNTIAFGSCNRHNADQPLWSDIIAQGPDLWIWLGDNVYGDSEDMDVIKAKYDAQKESAGYTALRSKTSVVGIWDDHDYGVNDGGKEYPPRAQSRDLLFDFLDVATDHPARSYEGAYQAHTFGDEENVVKVLLLDARYFRDPIEKIGGTYQPNESGTVLGEAQWAWLEKELDDQDVDLFVIGSGIQILPTQHRFEKWANFPNERLRLIQLLESKKPNGVVLLSGDRHIGEISVLEDTSLPYPIVDVTSSGLTHAYEGPNNEENVLRKGGIVKELNFGVLKLDWSGSNLAVDAEIRGQGGDVKQSYRIQY